MAFREENAARYPDYFNGAVPSFAPPDGEDAVRLLIVGLAPGLHGANQTGRPFTGDYAGDLLYDVLARHGLAQGEYAGHADDGFSLNQTMVSNAVRCVPPQNKPVGAEITACRPFLQSRIASLPSLKVILCLGKISHDSTARALGLKLKDVPFGHGTEYPLPEGQTLLSSYHCSRYNTNTGRLTEEMFSTVIARAAALMTQ